MRDHGKQNETRDDNLIVTISSCQPVDEDGILVIDVDNEDRSFIHKSVRTVKFQSLQNISKFKRKTVKCWKCKSTNHIKRNCPLMINNACHVSNLSCYYCGVKGHVVAKCPTLFEYQ